jgi:hypothetical protein
MRYNDLMTLNENISFLHCDAGTSGMLQQPAYHKTQHHAGKSHLCHMFSCSRVKMDAFMAMLHFYTLKQM